MEFHLVQGRLDEFPFEPFLRHALQGLHDQVLNGIGLVRVRAAKPYGENDLPQVRLEPCDGREVFAKPRVDEGLAKGSCRSAHQGMGGNTDQEHFLGCCVLRHHPGQVDGRLPCQVLALAYGIAVTHRARFFPPGLQPDCRLDAHPSEAAQDVLQEGQMIFRRDAAVEEEVGIRRGIVEPVKLPELLPREPGNDLGITAGIEAVGVVGKEVLLEGLVHEAVGRRVGPFHLVVDNARDGQVASWIVWLDKLQVMPLLQKGLLQDPGLEHQVGVHAGQVEVIDGYLAGHRVEGLVRVGEGVDEGLQRRPRKLVEGVLHGVGFGAGKHGVLQDVGDSRRVPGRRAEPHGKEVLAVVDVKVKELCPRGEVLHLVGRTADIIDSLDPADPEAPRFLPLPQAWFWTLSWTVSPVAFPPFSRRRSDGGIPELSSLYIAAGGTPLQGE